jgi:hypothetical protein
MMRIVDIAGMAGRVAQPHDTFDFGERGSSCEAASSVRPGLPVVGVDVLPNEVISRTRVVGSRLRRRRSSPPGARLPRRGIGRTRRRCRTCRSLPAPWTKRRCRARGCSRSGGGRKRTCPRREFGLERAASLSPRPQQLRR